MISFSSPFIALGVEMRSKECKCPKVVKKKTIYAILFFFVTFCEAHLLVFFQMLWTVYKLFFNLTSSAA